MKLCLDTNAYTALMRGHAAVADQVRRAERVLVSAIVAGELMFGFRNGLHYEKNLKDFSDFLDNPYVELIPVSLITADRFGRIAASLRRKGKPLPTNDIWIAAHAIESGAELLSSDRHFEWIEGLIWTRI
jgi:predicted nucleic acid-binding protein